KKFDFFLTDEFFVALVTHLIICIARLSSGKNVDECFLPPEAEYYGLERNTAEYVASGIEKEYNLEFPESERIYICMHLMSYNTFNSVEKESPDDILKKIPKKIELLTICLIDYVDAQLGTSFAQDKLLFFGILFHLKNSLQRLEESIPVKTIQRNEFSRNNAEVDSIALQQSLRDLGITNQCRDFLHKLSTRLINENQVIFLEDLRISKMVKDSRLAKSILDCSWSEFFRLSKQPGMQCMPF
ncbi:MAG TPA: PRD domain-containing protein, partial [Anaerovoracaceae bacterium]|nr:PRD domain-containing protein [Anaerovoracaceae bacterium]